MLGENTLTKIHTDDHYCKCQVKYIFNYLSHIAKSQENAKVLILSIDDKAKVKVGNPAVSRFVHSKKYFKVSNGPRTADHDFPIGSKFLLIPSGSYFNVSSIIL